MFFFLRSFGGASVANPQSRQAIIPALNALVLNPFEDLFDDLFGGNDKDKLGNIPGAAPILHYFYPYLPKKILKPFKPVVDLRQNVIGSLNALGLNPFEDILDDLFGGNDKDKLGNIPGAAPILHYFYPYLPKRVLKPFKPVVDLKTALARNAVHQAVAERIFELKYAAAVNAMRNSHYQQRLYQSMSNPSSRFGRQFFDISDVDESTVDKDVVDEDDGLGGDDGVNESEAAGLFEGSENDPLAKVFRFFIPSMDVENKDFETDEASNETDGKQLLDELPEPTDSESKFI